MVKPVEKQASGMLSDTRPLIGSRFKRVLCWFSIGLLWHLTMDSFSKSFNKTTKQKVKLSPFIDLALWMESSESVDLWLLKGLAAVEQHVGVWRLHKAVPYLSDRWVVKTVPGPSQGVVAQSCVVAHVQMTSVVLRKERVIYMKDRNYGQGQNSTICHLIYGKCCTQLPILWSHHVRQSN